MTIHNLKLDILHTIKPHKIIRIMKIIISIAAITCVTSCTAAVVGGAVAAGGTGVATATDTRGSSNVIKDQKLEHSVNSVLSAQIPHGSFTVASYGQHVLLAGQVPNAADKAKAQEAVSNTAGVKGVWNYLSIKPNQSATSITHDAYLTSAAKTRLIAQKNVNTNNIKVVTSDSIVYLLGHKIGSRSQLNAAIVGIKGISGVHNVVNLTN